MVKFFAIACVVSVLNTQAFAHGDHHARGEKLYETHCAACHGIDGDGNGPAGKNLDPAPANLLEAMQEKIISDEYLMWTIREGGRNIHTDMPSFEDRGDIDQKDAKDIIKYLRHAFE